MSKRQLPTWLKLVLCFSTLMAVTAISFWGLPASLEYHVTERYSFSGNEGDSIYLGLLLPRCNVSQTVKNVHVSWLGEKAQEQRDEIDMLKLSAEATPENFVEAVVEYDIILHAGRTSWDDEVDDAYLQPQPGIECNHPTILHRASMITTGNSRDDAYAIYQYTSDHVAWSEASPACTDMSALQAYEIGEGSCSGFANLMVALCRAAGIPARRMSGIVLPDLLPSWSTTAQAWEHPGEAHGWVEVHTERGWETADPSCASGVWNMLLFGRQDGRYLSFGECEAEGRSYADLYSWATRNGELIGKEFAALKFVAAADDADVTVTPRVSVKKGWDGRIFNAIVIWLITMVPVGSLSYGWAKAYWPSV